MTILFFHLDKLLFIEVIEFMASMAYNGYVAGCSGDGVSRPVPTRRRTYLVTHVCVFFVDQDVKTPEPGWVRRVAIYINKHTIRWIVLNLLTT